MNNARRKRINDVVERLTGIHADLEELASDEREAFDNLPESIQMGEKGQQIEEYADALDNAANAADEITTELQEITG